MKQKRLWQLSVITNAEAEDAVAELLARISCKPTAIYSNAETKVATVSVYLATRAEWAVRNNAELTDGLKMLGDAGLNIGEGRIEIRQIAREDWSESWKRHFKPIEIGSRLLVKPSWIKRRPCKNQAVVVLDPGLSFGTGNHPTTAFCLSELAAGRCSGNMQSFWDIGTGSGILAIAAVKLGYSPVRAVDFDPEAVRVARQNAHKNRVLEKLQIARQDVTKIPVASRQKYDFICANLISDLLIAQRQRIVNRLRTNGRLVLAGILEREFWQVQRAYERCGLRLVSDRVEGEWRSGAFKFR